MSTRRRFRLFALGLCLGAALFVLAGLLTNPFSGPPACPGCAVLTHPYKGCAEQVQGGYVCP